MHMRALKAHLATRGRLPLNVRLVIEGEEEVGSESLGRYVESAPELKADVVVISDTSMPAIDAPAICYSLRGIAVLEMTVRAPRATCIRDFSEAPYRIRCTSWRALSPHSTMTQAA